MSILAVRSVSPSILERVHALVQRLIAHKPGTRRLHADITSLPAALLKDIGVDLRDVPADAADWQAVPYRSYGGLAAEAVIMANKAGQPAA